MEDRGTILATVTAPDGSTLDYTDKYAKALEKIGSAYPEFDRIFANLGNPTVAQGSVIYRAVDWDERKRTTLEIAREMQGKFNGIAGVNAFPITPHPWAKVSESVPLISSFKPLTAIRI